MLENCTVGSGAVGVGLILREAKRLLGMAAGLKYLIVVTAHSGQVSGKRCTMGLLETTACGGLKGCGVGKG